MVEKTRGTLIHLSPYSETSLIVCWCTNDQGLVRTLAKGARRPKSAFAGKLDLFFHCEITFARSRRSDLHVLTEVQLANPRLGLRQTYLRTLTASYFIKLVELAAERDTPIVELAELLERGLDYLSAHTPDLRAVEHFERETSKNLGLGQRGIEAIGELYGTIPSMRKDLLQRLSP